MSLLPPNSELVTVAWMRNIPEIGNNVGTTRPQDNSTWAASGFTQVGPVAGGSVHRYADVSMPVMSIHCWAFNPNSSKPPWGKAARLAQAIEAYTYRPDQVAREVSAQMPSGYAAAAVRTAYLPGMPPRRAPTNNESYAHFIFDLAIWWYLL